MKWTSVLVASVAVAGAQEIKPGGIWYDTDGNRIYAGGANIYEEGGSYYWIGEGNKDYPGERDISSCFNLYRSPDLVSWTHLGCALNNSDIKADAAGPYRMERPKLFKCPSNSKHMLVFHCDTVHFGINSIGIATADTVAGPYKMSTSCFQPNGLRSYDMGTFQDQTGTYLVRSVENDYAGISKFNDDCMGVGPMLSNTTYAVEGQALFSFNSTYYLMGSHLTGWNPNAAIFAQGGTDLAGSTWKQLGNPTHDSTTYDSQSTFVFPYKHPDGHITLMYMGDRWNQNGPGGLHNASYIWLPFVPPKNASDSWTVPWLDSWKLSDY